MSTEGKSRELEEIIDLMEREARKRGAAVYTLESNLLSPFQHLVAAILSSRTRDEATIKASERLFEVVSSPEDLLKLDEEEIERRIRGVGFYRVKARRLKELAKTLVENYGSEVPLEMEELLKLPGVGRKTANIVLVSAGKAAIPVDTHVHRIANRLGLVKTRKPEETERELKKVFPRELWSRLNRAFVGFGQTVCKPVKPLCSECPLSDICPSAGEKRGK